jgi:hypothetical protein
VSKPAPPFIAVDGEATEEGYCLLANSLGQTTTDLRPGGLHTIRCLEFLLQSPKPSIVCCFGLNYDVNNWLRDIPRHILQELWKTNVCYWRAYRLEWIPGRWLAIKDVDGRYIKVHEVWGFFQSSFVKALEAWGIGAPSEIERMKAERGSFKASQIKKVTRYCLHECSLLVELMGELRDACREAGIVPRSWIGAGALAMALLGAQGMDDHHVYDLDLAPEQVVEDVVLGAYFAGRIELHRQGVFNAVKTADIRSAYPSAAHQLPSLDGAKLSRRKRLVEGPGIWHVRWDAPETMVAPFPVRQKHAIYYPAKGEGWYHTVEVMTAIRLGYPVEVLEGYTLKRRNMEKPFKWIPGVYAKRAALKDEGHAAEKALKLALNSVYGKLAQGYGFNSRPRWQNYFWAGQITATTRAKILTAASKARAPIMIATDGIFCQSLPGNVRDGKALGAWELAGVPELFAAQAGVYQGRYTECSACGRPAARHPHKGCEVYNEKETLKSRGFFAAEVDYDALREGFESEGADYIHQYKSRRFMGLGVSLTRKDFGVWRSWREETRALLLRPERKGLREDGVLTPHPGPLISDPYEPKVGLIDQRALDQAQGHDQPLKATQ